MNGQRRFWVVVLGTLALATLAVGCWGGGKTHAYKIAGIILQEDQFFHEIQMGMQAAADKLDVDLQLGNSSNNEATEASLVETYTTDKVDAIAISVKSVKTSVTALKQAHDRGIKVLIYNGYIEADFPETSIESDQVNIGELTGEAAAKFITDKMGGKANVAMLEFISQALEQGHMRPDGFKSKVGKLPGVKIVTEQDGWVTDKATGVVENILTGNPEVNLVWGANEGGTLGSVLGVKSKNMAGKVFVFGTDMSEQTAKFLLADDNILQAVTGQKPYEMGYMAIETAVKVIKGEKVEKKMYTPGVLYSRDNPEPVKKYLADLKKLTN